MVYANDPYLLFSARDMGAAQSIAELYSEAHSQGWKNLTLVGCGIAAEYFSFKKLPHIKLDWDVVENSKSGDQLLEKAYCFYRKEKFDGIITGLSGLGIGLDEALIKVADCPTFSVQDFWGDINFGFSKIADFYFVLDEMAHDLSCKKGLKSENCHIVGSIKHSTIDKEIENIDAEIKNYRQTLGVNKCERILLICGQPLWSFPGYEKTMELLLEIALSVTGLKVIYRPHPAETLLPNIITKKLLLTRDKKLIVDNKIPLYIALAACDMNCSVFSTCGWDQIVLSRCLKRPLGMVSYLLAEPSIKKMLFEITGLNDVPVCQQGFATEVHSFAILEDKIKLLFGSNYNDECFHAIRKHVVNPSSAARNALSKIYSTITK